MGKTKTIKIAAVDPNKFDRILVDNTQKINPQNLDLSSSFEEEIAHKSYSDLEYMLKFEVTDSQKRQQIKERMKILKKK